MSDSPGKGGEGVTAAPHGLASLVYDFMKLCSGLYLLLNA